MAVPDHIEALEIERKYAVSPTATLPEVEHFARLGLAVESAHTAPQQLQLDATYFDTPELLLGQQRVAVRMRRGGKDAGWHMKIKSGEGTRELMWPPAETMPDGLAQEIRERLGADPALVTTIAQLNTRRIVTRLFDDGVPVVELADDYVTAVNVLTGRRQQWREWEAELLVGDPEVLDRIEPLMLSTGARRSQGTSKIERTMRALT